MSIRPIELQVADGVARITLTNPQNYNCIDLEFTRELAAAATKCAADPGIRAILIAAQGDVFCVGGDIKDFIANKHRSREHLLEMASTFHLAVTHLRSAAAPVILALNGMAAGGGFSLVCGADLVIAKRSAKLNSAYTRSGLTPDGGGTFFLPRIVGIRKAFDIMATNPTLSADQAYELGIVSRVVDDAEFDAEVEKAVRGIADMIPEALASLKALLNASPSAALQQQLAAEAQSLAKISANPATLDRLSAFLNKKK
jgi:2-(1,2-epoxy-1,2-dihydrophenyl)acetyl-CoA isomerase